MGNLLIIDADTAGRGIVRSRIADIGHNVRVSESCALGIEAALGGDFDCVLVAADLDEGSTGIDLCHNLRGHREMEDTAIIVYSLVQDHSLLLAEALEAGAHTAVTPDQGTQLERVVDAAINSRSQVKLLRERQGALRVDQRRLAEQLSRVPQASEGASTDIGATAIVDAEGVVRYCDGLAWGLLGRDCIGRTLREIAPGSGLDGFVRSARTVAQHEFRFDLVHHDGSTLRSLVASAQPMTEGRRCVTIFEGVHARPTEPVMSRNQMAALFDAAARAHGLDQIPGDGPVAAHLRRSIAARTNDRDPLLLVGETGTGRSFLARVLHYQVEAQAPVLSLRCSAFSPETLEQELFGAARTDQLHRPGALFLAGNGTVILEGIEAMPIDLQARMLEVLRIGRLSRPGSRERAPIHARIIATTTEDLTALVEQGRFLGNLASLLLTCKLEVPALRNRGTEVGSLIEAALERAGAAGIEEAALHLLQQHSWPRNLTELSECLERAVRLAGDLPISVAHLPRSFGELSQELSAGGSAPTELRSPGGTELQPMAPWSIGAGDPISFAFYERQAIVRALHACRGDRLAAARLLHVGKSTLYRKIRQLGID